MLVNMVKIKQTLMQRHNIVSEVVVPTKSQFSDQILTLQQRRFWSCLPDKNLTVHQRHSDFF